MTFLNWAALPGIGLIYLAIRFIEHITPGRGVTAEQERHTHKAGTGVTSPPSPCRRSLGGDPASEDSIEAGFVALEAWLAERESQA